MWRVYDPVSMMQRMVVDIAVNLSGRNGSRNEQAAAMLRAVAYALADAEDGSDGGEVGLPAGGAAGRWKWVPATDQPIRTS